MGVYSTRFDSWLNYSPGLSLNLRQMQMSFSPYGADHDLTGIGILLVYDLSDVDSMSCCDASGG